MTQQILDTSVLIRQWRRREGLATRPLTKTAVLGWAKELVKSYGTQRILTPVKLEFICGVRNKTELQLAVAFLNAFEVADHGNILAVDWQDAARIARRVPRSGRPRQLGDCLVRAIANRLRLDVISFDENFPI